MRHTVLLPIAFLGALLLPGCERAQEGQTYAPNYEALGQCERPTRPILTSIVAGSLCGTISVFEDRDAQAGRKIDLNVMVIPAFDRLPQPDPVFFLAGGPGQAATEFGPYVAQRLFRLRQDRDIVLVDQRGTGKSNALDCVPDTDITEDITLPIEQIVEHQIESVRNCLATIDASPALYTTPVAMDDLNEVRERLGFGEINLFGISYGTRAALVYMRRHGETVRSALLDGVVPLTMRIPQNVAVDAQTAFDSVVGDCSKSPTCNEAFPDLRGDFDTLLDHLATPQPFTFVHPHTGVPEAGILHRVTVTRLLRGVLYDRTLSSLIPLAIHEAAAANYQPLVTLGSSFYGDENPMSIGMTASVLCSEDMQLTDGPNDHALDFDNEIYRMLAPICEFWPRGDLPDNYFDAVSSDVPTLLTSGALDPITPPAYAIEAMQTLSNSMHIIVPGVGHSAVFAGCMPDLVVDFIETADPKSLDDACTADLKRPPFFTRFTGLFNAPVEGAQ